MRYLRVLVLAIFIFFALIFFFQNQGPLSQDIVLSLNLFFLPPMTSIPLPFYFIVIAAFFVGCVLAVCSLIWDKFITSSRLMKSKWRISSLEKENTKLHKEVDNFKAEKTAPALAADTTAKAETGK